MLREAIHYAWLAVSLAGYVRGPRRDAPVLPEPEEQRSERFLRLARENIFDRPENPYRGMFELAGCDWAQLGRAVRRDGLEPTLGALHDAGVYLTHAELKGLSPVMRDGRRIPAPPGALVNRRGEGRLTSRTSGSRSRGTAVPAGVGFRLHNERYLRFIAREFQLDRRPLIEIWPILPSTAGLVLCTAACRLGWPLRAWYAVGGGLKDTGHYRAVTGMLAGVCRSLGAAVPPPQYLPENDFGPVADHLGRLLEAGSGAAVLGYVSPAVRVAGAALDRGIDLSGTLFVVTGEALTGAKRRVIEAAGAEACPLYWAVELGPIGCACRQIRQGNDVHLFRDSLAVISRDVRVGDAGVLAPSLRFTALGEQAPLMLINAEMEDSAAIEPAACECTFSGLGFRQRLSGIFSYGKLTGHGMTLLGADVLEILERMLPERLGGRAGDYQLVEREVDSQTRIELRASPRTGLRSADELRAVFLELLRGCYGGSLAARTWRHAHAVDAVIAEPLAGATGKVLPLHLLGGPSASPRSG